MGLEINNLYYNNQAVTATGTLGMLKKRGGGICGLSGLKEHITYSSCEKIIQMIIILIKGHLIAYPEINVDKFLDWIMSR